MELPSSSRGLTALCILSNFDTRVRNMRPHRRARTSQSSGHFFGWQIFHIAQYQRGALPGREPFEPCRQPVTLFAAQQRSFGRFQMPFRRFAQFHKRHAPAAAEKIERGIGGDARQPMRRLQLVFELVLPLQGFDESFLREILRVMNAADHTINLKENAAQMFGDEGFAQSTRGFMPGQQFAARIVRSR